MEKCARILMLDKELIKHLKGQTCALHNGSIENRRCARIQSATGNVRDERVRYTTVPRRQAARSGTALAVERSVPERASAREVRRERVSAN